MVEVSITATSLERLAGQKRDWAKAEDAKAKAIIINSKGGRYVFIRKWIKADVRQSTANGSILIFGGLRLTPVWMSAGDWTTNTPVKDSGFEPASGGSPHELSPRSQNHFFC